MSTVWKSADYATRGCTRFTVIRTRRVTFVEGGIAAVVDQVVRSRPWSISSVIYESGTLSGSEIIVSRQ